MQVINKLEQSIQDINQYLQKQECPLCGKGAGPFAICERLYTKEHAQSWLNYPTVNALYCSYECARADMWGPRFRGAKIRCLSLYTRYLAEIHTIQDDLE